MEINHVLPQLGPVSVRLYEPAENIYQLLERKNEIYRLNCLRHLGALTLALPGARLYRWDYTAALLFFSGHLDPPKFKTKIKIGKIEFSSVKAALQCASLIWNIGHLPGTYAVEKGVCRYLLEKSEKNPAKSLQWKFKTNPLVRHAISKSNELIVAQDYVSISKVLAVKKLFSWCESENCWLFDFVSYFAAPLLLEYTDEHATQWQKINEAFKLIRHLSYLSMDIPFSGQNWAPNVKDLVDHQFRIFNDSIVSLSESVSELLSPIERNVYEVLYHSESARREAAIFSHKTYEKLKVSSDPFGQIDRWLSKGIVRDMKLGKRLNKESLESIVSIRTRSHFTSTDEQPSALEGQLVALGFTHPIAFKYTSWNTDKLFEPDESIIDIFTTKKTKATDIGSALYWFISCFDRMDSQPDDFLDVTNRIELDPVYRLFFSKAVERYFPEMRVELESWNLRKFGLFKEISFPIYKGSVWAASATLDDQFTKYLVRDRRNKVLNSDKDDYQELMGINKLRRYLKASWKSKKPRCRWLIITASIKFYSKTGKTPIIEYDGALLKIASRSGKLTWYGLESKNGNENPHKSLKKRLEVLGIDVEPTKIDSKSAFVEIEL